MSATIDATVGGTSANCYLLQSEAQTYFDARLRPDKWTAASDTDKVRALISATRRLDEEEFEGVKAQTTQALKWPRSGAHDPDGYGYLSTIIPHEIKDATCELALALLANDLLVDTGLEAFTSIEIGPLKVTPKQTRRAGALPAEVRRKIAHVLTTPSTSNVRLSR